MRIRPETHLDRDGIAAVTRAAFGNEREVRMIEAIRASPGFVPELSLVAEEDRQIVGHVLLSYVELEGTGRRLLELGPLSVLPDRQRSGVGSALVRKGLRLADARRAPLVLVPHLSGLDAAKLAAAPEAAQVPVQAILGALRR